MAVRNMTHDREGEALTRVPVKHKVSLGYPRGYKKTEDSEPLNRPQRVYHFRIQTRNDDGEWELDSKLRSELVGDEDKPRELEIQLVGSDIKDMIKSDLAYWSQQHGLQCSCGTLDSHFQAWCKEKGVKWEGDIVNASTESELRYLLDNDKIDAKVKDYLDTAKILIGKYKERMGELWEEYDPAVTDVIDATLAHRMVKGEYKPWPCLHYKCPDFMKGDCKLDGRFFFALKGHETGEISMLVTSSSKNIRQIQDGIEKIVNKVLKSGGRNYQLHGIHMKLVGTVERGYYHSPEGRKSSKYFLVSLKGPGSSVLESGTMILEEARALEAIYPDPMKIEFDEGEPEQVAAERIAEFVEPEIDDKTVIPDERKQAEGEKGPADIDIEKDEHQDKRSTKRHIEKDFTAALEVFREKDPELTGVIEPVLISIARSLDRLPEKNGILQYSTAVIDALEKQEISIERILKSRDYLEQLGVKKPTLKKVEKLGEQKDG